MYRNKNFTHAHLAFFISSMVALLFAAVIYFFSKNWLWTSISFITVFAVIYLFVYNLFDQFVYRKIKLIYKFISQTKATWREEFYNQELLPQKTIEQVNDDVEQWASEQKNEIERLQSNVAFRREFLMNLAHELKTPLFAAHGFIDTLLDGAIDDPNVNKLFLEKASKSIDRLNYLVRDLDEISKLESNQIPIHKSEFIIQHLIIEVFDELSQKATKRNIRCSIKKGCEQSFSVYADRDKIKQVLVNLVENSLNYGRENGETVAGIYAVDGTQIFVEITDNGMGISEENVPRVFERFYRTDTARSRNYGGSGLGLAIVKHIVEAHHQSVSCRSTLDVGTSFGFTLERP